MSIKNLVLNLSRPLVLTAVALSGSPRTASAQAPPGWNTQTIGNQKIFTPPDLGSSEVYRVVVYPRISMGGADITNYLNAFGTKELASLGTDSKAVTHSEAKNYQLATFTRVFVSKQGQPLFAFIVALSGDDKNVCIVSVLASQDLAAFKRYTPQMLSPMNGLGVKSDYALAARQGLTTRKTADIPGSLKPGVHIIQGIYSGDSIESGTGKFAKHFRLHLFVSGANQYYITEGGKCRQGDGRYSFDPLTGKLGLGQTFGWNRKNHTV